jgi:hypothetical protein
VGGLDVGYDVQVTTSAADVTGNDLDHEYPLREIIQKKKTKKQNGGTVGKFLQPYNHVHIHICSKQLVFHNSLISSWILNKGEVISQWRALWLGIEGYFYQRVSNTFLEECFLRNSPPFLGNYKFHYDVYCPLPLIPF